MEKRLEEIILEIHEATLTNNFWHSIMASTMHVCEAEHAVVLTVGMRHSAPAIARWESSPEFNPAALAEYAQHWAAEDLLYSGARDKGRIRTGLVSTEEELVERSAYQGSRYFNEFLRPYNLNRHLNLCLTHSIPELMIGPSAITLYRGLQRQSFEGEAADALKLLSSHIVVAARTRWQFETLASGHSLRGHVLDQIRIPVFGIDADGYAVFMNSAGMEIIRAERWLTASRNVLTPAPSLLRGEEARRALSRVRRGIGGTLLLTDGSSRAQAVMTTACVPSESDFQVVSRRIVGLVWIVPFAVETAPVKALSHLFELTPAETRLLERLVLGETVGIAAGILGITGNTARTQLKAIFRKTGRRNQRQLVEIAQRMALIRANDR